MIGKYQINIDVQQFAQGMASSDYATDGGLGTSSTWLNPFITLGVMQGTAGATDKSTNVSGNIVATSDDSQATSPNNRIMVDAAGAIYSVGGTGTVTKQITAGAKTYSFGVTDMVPFKALNYYTSTTHLASVNTSAWTRSETLQTFNDSSAHHPELVYEQLLWVGDGNYLSNYDGSTWNAQSNWTLDASEKIVALGIDPVTGMMLVSVQISYNPTDSLQQKGIIYMYDGYSARARRKIITDDLVTAFYPVGGTVYVGMGQILGKWNGAGVSYLRKLKNVTLVQNDLPYKHHFSNLRNILLVMDGSQVLAYGEVLLGKPAFFYVAASTNTSTPITLCRIGNNIIALSSATNTFEVIDMSSANGGTSGKLYLPNFNMPRPIYVRRVRVITTGVTNAGGSLISRGTLNLYDETGTGNQAATPTFDIPASSTKYVFDFDYTSLKLQTLQPEISFEGFSTSNSLRVARIIIYYDIAE